jgi:hypothetical protein
MLSYSICKELEILIENLPFQRQTSCRGPSTFSTFQCQQAHLNSHKSPKAGKKD